MAQAGWYPDSEAVNGERYWDGNQWTEHRRQETPAAPTAQGLSAPEPRRPRPTLLPLLSRSWFLVVSILAELVVFGSIARAGGAGSPLAAVASVLAVAAIVASIVLFRRGRPKKQRTSAPKPKRRNASSKAGTAADTPAAAVARANDEVVAAKALAREKIGMLSTRVGLVVLTPFKLRTPRGEITLGPSTKVTVSTAGNVATNTVNKQMLWKGYQQTQVHDVRELYLEVEGPDNAVSLACNPRDGEKVREFAALIRRKAATVDESRASIDRQTAIALEHLRAATSELHREAAGGVSPGAAGPEAPSV
jgi:hypothetical protein